MLWPTPERGVGGRAGVSGIPGKCFALCFFSDPPSLRPLCWGCLGSGIRLCPQLPEECSPHLPALAPAPITPRTLHTPRLGQRGSAHRFGDQDIILVPCLWETSGAITLPLGPAPTRLCDSGGLSGSPSGGECGSQDPQLLHGEAQAEPSGNASKLQSGGSLSSDGVSWVPTVASPGGTCPGPGRWGSQTLGRTSRHTWCFLLACLELEPVQRLEGV